MNYKGTKILLFILIVLILANMYLLIKEREIFELRFNDSLKSMHEKIESMSEEDKIPQDGNTPVKGVDYFDGKTPACYYEDSQCRGADGKDSVSTHTETTVIQEVPINGKNGNDGVDGKTPILRCNVQKNRWEVSYIGDNVWQILNGTPVPCTIKEKE